MAVIPADRLYPWQGAVGVPGGVPPASRTTICSTPQAVALSAASNGSDINSLLTNAIASCPSNQIVRIPNGTFTVGQINMGFKSEVTVRGGGRGVTILRSTAGVVFNNGNADFPFPGFEGGNQGTAITGGATAGSTSITVANGALFSVGKLCHITQPNLPWVASFGNDHGPFSITFRVVNVSGNVVTINHPLPFTFNNVTQNDFPRLVNYTSFPITGVGFESFTIDKQNSGGTAIQQQQAYGCWIYDVEVTNSSNRQFYLIVWNQGTIKHCTTHNTLTTTGPNHEGIDLNNLSCWNLVEDNICENGGFPQIMLGDSKGGCAGNAIVYNLAINAATGTDLAGADIGVNHGPHNSFNLVEGNIANMISADGYFGSSSHNTFFRNWILAKLYTTSNPTRNVTTLVRGVQIERWSNYFNVVGNVIGDSTFPNSGGGGGFESTVASYPENQLIRRLGYPSFGNTGFTGSYGPSTPPTCQGNITGSELSPRDLNTNPTSAGGTLIYHGNYDYFNHAIVWDTGIADHTIPTSYIYSSRPLFFGNLAWPPFDPTSPPGTANNSTYIKIPAGYRYVNGVDPPGGGGPLPPAISVSPSFLDFGAVAVGQTRDLAASVDNVGEGTVAGSASTSTPFSIVSGSPYSVTTGTADVTIRYTPAAAGTSNDSVVFTGGGGTAVSATGTGTAVISGLTFAADAGTITAPFQVDGSHHVFQSPEVTPVPSDGGRAAYTFTIVSAGDYRVVINVDAPDGGSNSFFINIDAEPTTNELWSIAKYTSGFEDRTVSWLGNSVDEQNPQFPNKVFTLTAGQHTLIIRGRESDTYLGQITITPAAALNPPGAPSAPNPANAAVDVAISANLSWTATNATTYDLKFGDVNPPPQVASGLTTPFYDPLSLNYSTTYFWQVTARNADGSTVGPVWSFTTTVPVEVISSPSPANGALGVALNPTLRWNGAGDSYDVYLDDVSPPVTVYVDQVSNSFDVSVIRGPLDYSTVYYWKIVSNHASGPDVTGPEWSFTTMDIPTTVPVPKIIIVS